MARRRIVERRFSAFMHSPLSVQRAMTAIVTATVVSVILGGVLIRIVDPRDFPSVGLGLWWALQTVTTVGYGDVVPTHPVGRAIGAVIMLESIAFIAIVTAAITSNFVERARRQAAVSAGEPDLKVELARLFEQLDRIERRLDEIDRDPSGGRLD